MADIHPGFSTPKHNDILVGAKLRSLFELRGVHDYGYVLNALDLGYVRRYMWARGHSHRFAGPFFCFPIVCFQFEDMTSTRAM